MDALTATPPDILSEAGINGNNLYAKFCKQEGHTAMPASEKIEHIFSELYDLPERMYLLYFKVNFTLVKSSRVAVVFRYAGFRKYKKIEPVCSRTGGNYQGNSQSDDIRPKTPLYY